MEKLRLCRVGFICIFLSIFEYQSLAQDRATAGPLGLLGDQVCPPSQSHSCEALKREITSAWEKLQQRSSFHEQAFLRLKLNRALENYQARAQKADSKRLERIHHKYNNLQDILHNSTHVERNQIPDIAYHHLEMNAVQEVFKQFGVLEISPEDVSTKDAPRWLKLEVKPPWSGYWYPRYDPVLYAGGTAVFAKVDRMMARIGRESRAQDVEASLAAGHPESWEGLCNAWSNASILEPEPRTSINVLGEKLSIADQKALLTKVYESYPVTMFGIRYDGDHLTDGTYQDIRPEALHRIILSVLGDRQKPFIIDDTAGTEVWQQPVFRVDWTIQTDETYGNAYQVNMRLWKIKMRNRVTEDLTSRNDYAFEQYQFRLFVDPEVQAQEGRLLVIAGEWLGESRRKHPDYVVLPQEYGQPATHNVWIQYNLDPLMALLKHPTSFEILP